MKNIIKYITKKENETLRRKKRGLNKAAAQKEKPELRKSSGFK